MWPQKIEWHQLRFGVEIEFVGGSPTNTELLPEWIMALDEKQIDHTGLESGSELKPPPLLWEDREQIRMMVERLRAQGAEANWSCGLHVHVGLEPWGQDIILPLLDAALASQEALQQLLQTSRHRKLFCPPVTPLMREQYIACPVEDSVRTFGRPQSHRCGINTAAWFDIGTVEIRFANGSLHYDEIIRTVELCLKFVAAVGEGRTLASESLELARQLQVPADGYPPAQLPPQWFQERTWLEEQLIPLLSPIAGELVPDGEIHHILPQADGLLVAVEDRDGKLFKFLLEPPSTGWKVIRPIR